MDRVLAAADVVVENAGGLTAMEAMARGVPVVTYTPIAGHGRANALAMAEAGVAVYAHSPSDLVSCLVELGRDTPAKRRLVSSARSMFGPDPAELIAAWALSGVVGAPGVPVAGSGASQGLPCRPPRPSPRRRPVDWRP
jgi:UDP-N-acetylglucosamine:LPS N-acetylglucosamine transferase